MTPLEGIGKPTPLTNKTLTRPQSSLFLLLILTRDARPRGARGVMGRRKDVFLFPFPPSHHSLRSCFSRSAIPHARLPRLAKRDDWGRVRIKPTRTNSRQDEIGEGHKNPICEQIFSFFLYVILTTSFIFKVW